MTAIVTVDSLGKRFDVRILAQEGKTAADESDSSQPAKVANQPPIETVNNDHVTRVEIKSDESLANNDAQTSTTVGDGDKESPPPADEDPLLETVGQLRSHIAEKLQIEADSARIIHRGKLIGNNKDERLSTLRFKNKDTIKVMGKAVKMDPGFASLCAYERTHLVKLNKTFEQNGQDLDSLERNFLEGPNRAEMIKKTEKTLQNFNHTAEKHLEAIDSLPIYNDDISEEQKTRNREKRKQLVDGVLNLLHLNDKYLHRLDDYKFRSEHPDEGR